MPLVAADIKIFKTTNNLGGAITANELVSATLNGLYDKFTGDETTAGGTFYACIYVKNDHGSITAENLRQFILSETDHAGINFSLGLGTSALNGVEQTIANETTAPAGVTFGDTDTTTTGAATQDDTLTLGDVPFGQHRAVWVRCVIDAGTTAVNNYQATMRFLLDTAA